MKIRVTAVYEVPGDATLDEAEEWAIFHMGGASLSADNPLAGETLPYPDQLMVEED
ncbi:hypothetical protein [Roseateles terrae]|uniref:Uncharacterized protein n=1 Tax=Roseateles terrae TaxID=431060 RepID=A0ABR6GPF3_9BURK|nr:hypothetical protein [Roseateles terrae]MBB3193983.1 hypothetical protein [Roseateles terrae]